MYYLSKTNSAFFVEGDINRIINKYYSQIQEIIRGVNENFYMIVATTDLVISDGAYDFPDGTGSNAAPAYEKVKSIWASYVPADITNPLPTDYVRVDLVDPNQISQPAYTFNSDQPKALVFGDYFVLLPLVTDATKYPVLKGVKIYYIPVLDKLVNDTDVPKIFSTFHDAITQGSLIDVAQRKGDQTLYKSATEAYKKRCEEIATYASNRILDVQLSVIEGQDAQGGWEFSWGNNSMA